MTLWTNFLNHSGRVIHKWKHYFPVYERHFSRFVNTDVTVLEIGCGRGGSLQLWKGYFGPHARIVGIDIVPECAQFAEDQIEIRIGSQSDTPFLKDVVKEFGPFDIVIDDGSHKQDDILASFEFLYPTVSRNGVYLVEDLHTSYWSEFGGGYQSDKSFIEFCKNKIDELNADWSRNALTPTEFTKSTLGISFYDSVCVFEKGRTTKKDAYFTGAASAAESGPSAVK